MIPRKLAKRLLDELIARVDAYSDEPDDGLRAVAHEVLEESDLVLRGTENVEQKGRRYLTEGRLTVERVDGESGLVVASCAGSEATYKLGRDPKNGQWRCTCPSPRKCSHLIALRLVVRL